MDEGSLTRRILTRCPRRFRVVLLDQAWGRPLPGEARILGLRFEARVLIREVELHCDATPWVYARTLIPVATLRRGARLGRLGTRPLGEVLFSDPAVRRGSMEMTRFGPAEGPMRIQGHRGVLWGRRTLFYIAGHPLLVNEIFLHGLPR